MGGLKPVVFRGGALETLLAFPVSAGREAGHQLGKAGREIRIHDASGAFRVLYVARFPEAIYVLHCFQKQTRRTSRTDVDLAARRYRDLMEERAG